MIALFENLVTFVVGVVALAKSGSIEARTRIVSAFDDGALTWTTTSAKGCGGRYLIVMTTGTEAHVPVRISV